MLESTPNGPSRRTLLSAAALLGGTAAISAAPSSPAAAAILTGVAPLSLTAKQGKQFQGIARYYDDTPASGIALNFAITPDGGTIYAVGTETKRIHATDVTTGAFTSSVEVAGMSGLSELVISGDTLYIGSGGGGVYEFTTTDSLLDPKAFRRLVAPDPENFDSYGNPSAWTKAIAVTDTHLAFGINGTSFTNGKLGILERSSGTVTVHEYPTGKSGIYGLVADDELVYGTTATVSISDRGTATVIGSVFAAELATGDLRWEQPMPEGAIGVSRPVLMGGTLYVTSHTSIIPINPVTGAAGEPITVLESPVAIGPRMPELVRVSGTTRLAHRSYSVISVVSTATGNVSTAYDDGWDNPHSSRQLVSDASGTLWMVMHENSAWSITLDNEGVGQPPRGGFMYWPYRAPMTSPFTDVSTSHVFYKEISWLAQARVSTGWSQKDGTSIFGPARSVLRDQMAAFMYRVAGSPEYTPPATSPFTDIRPGQTFYKEIAWLAERGVSNGWSQKDGTRIYGPARPVLRDQMAAFMYRLAGSPEYTPPTTSPFTDVSVSHVFYKEIAWLAERGVSNGWSQKDGTRIYGPARPVLRDQMAAFLYRLSAGSL